MKKLLLLFVLLFPFVSQAQDNALNEKYGFRDATFEKPLSAFKGMKLVKTLGHEKIYTRTTDKPTIGDYKAAIEYVFFDNLLSEVRITATGSENVNGLIYTMIEAYGEPLEVASGYAWRSTRVNMKGDIVGKRSGLFLRMYSIPMSLRADAVLEQERVDANKARTLREIKGAKKAASDI